MKTINKKISYFGEILSILGNEKKKIPFLVMLFLLSSLIELIGIGLIVPYVAMIITPEVFFESKFFQYLTLFNFPQEINELIILIGIVLFFIFLCKLVIGLGINRTIFKFSAQQGARLCKYLMRSFQGMDYSKYILRNSSEYIYSINTLSLNFALVFQACLRLMSESIVVLSIFILLALNDIYIVSVLSIIILGSIFLYDKFFARVLIKYGQLRNVAMQGQIKAINEGISGIKEIRMLSKEDFFYSKVKRNSNNYANYYVATNLISTSPRYFLEILIVFFIVFVIIINIQIGNDIKEIVPILALFGVASIRLLPTASQLMTSIALIRNGRDGISMLYKDLKDFDEFESSISKGTTENKKFESLKISNISFSYPESKLVSCKNISMEVKKDEFIGIIGASGAGKTTLIDLMLGLLQPQSGEIIFNDTNINENLVEWNSKIAYLPQEIFTLDDTISKNITLIEDTNDIDQNKLNESIKKSKLLKLVQDLPKGLDTVIGDRGIRLSGGQKQRIAIARAFYHEREVLVFDEATSSLDTGTEFKIMEEIKELKGFKTMIIITHRLQTVKNCDRVYQIENGQIVKSGKFAEVIN